MAEADPKSPSALPPPVKKSGRGGTYFLLLLLLAGAAGGGFKLHEFHVARDAATRGDLTAQMDALRAQIQALGDDGQRAGAALGGRLGMLEARLSQEGAGNAQALQGLRGDMDALAARVEQAASMDREVVDRQLAALHASEEVVSRHREEVRTQIALLAEDRQRVAAQLAATAPIAPDALRTLLRSHLELLVTSAAQSLALGEAPGEAAAHLSRLRQLLPAAAAMGVNLEALEGELAPRIQALKTSDYPGRAALLALWQAIPPVPAAPATVVNPHGGSPLWDRLGSYLRVRREGAVLWEGAKAPAGEDLSAQDQEARQRALAKLKAAILLSDREQALRLADHLAEALPGDGALQQSLAPLRQALARPAPPALAADALLETIHQAFAAARALPGETP